MTGFVEVKFLPTLFILFVLSSISPIAKEFPWELFTLPLFLLMTYCSICCERNILLRFCCPFNAQLNYEENVLPLFIMTPLKENQQFDFVTH